MSSPIRFLPEPLARAVVLVLCVVKVPMALATSFAAAPDERQLLVKHASGPASQASRETDALVRCTRIRSFDALGWHLVSISDQNLTVGEAMARYRAQPGVLDVEPNVSFQVDPPLPAGSRATPEPESRSSPSLHSPSQGIQPNDPRFGSQWNLRLIGMTNAWAVTTGSTNLVVAVIDGGIDYNHEDLRDNMWRNPGETGLDAQGRDKASNGVDDDGNGYADDVYGIDTADGDSDPMDQGSSSIPYGHGTACAGVIGALGNNGVGIAGVNWAVRLMALRILRSDTRAFYQRHYAAGVVAAIDYAVRMKRRGENLRLLSMSFSLARSRAFADAIDVAGREEILTITGTANGSRDTDQFSFYPGGFDSPYTVVVAATTVRDALIDYSDWGRSTVDVAAPTEVPTTAIGSKYITDFPGTSAACPHVTGAAALILAAHPTATALEVKAALMRSVDRPSALRGKLATSGRLNVARALETVKSTDVAPVVVGAFPASSRSDTRANLELWFDQPMDRRSVETALRTEPNIQGTWQWSDQDRVARLVPDEPFVRTNYFCRLLRSAKQVQGRFLDGDFDGTASESDSDDFVWGFRFGPENDLVESPFDLPADSGDLKGTTRNASAEPNDLFANNYPFYGISVWYRWTPVSGGWTTLDVTTSGTADFALVAFRGDPSNESNVVAFSDNDGTRSRPRLLWNAMPGEPYWIYVAAKIPPGGSIPNAEADFSLRWGPSPSPVITSFSPSSAVAGTTVTLNGSNFTGVTRVRFNGVHARFTTLTNTHNFYDLRLTAVVPVGATTGPITLETGHGTATSATSFEVVPSDVPLVLAARRVEGGLLRIEAPVVTLPFVLQTSPTLGPTAVWTPVWTNPASTPLQFLNSPSWSHPQFFRAVIP